MNKNTYLGLALTAWLSIVSSPLMAEVAPDEDINAPIPTFNEPQEPSEAQREKDEHNRANITAAPISAQETHQRHKAKHSKAKHDKTKNTAPETPVK